MAHLRYGDRSLRSETLASPRVSVIGLGKLGAPLAACVAAKGFHVIGVDASEEKVRDVNAGRAPVFEPGLDELIEASHGRLLATTDTSSAVAETDVTFIVVPTPSTTSGEFSLEYVIAACSSIGASIAAKSKFHLVVLTSTVMPGSTNGPVLRTLEDASGLRCGVGFGLCYSPEFIALGTVIHDFLNPDFLLVGESDPGVGDLLVELYQQTCENNPPIARMNLVNAELVKLAVNTFVTTKISFANTIARICERLPGADVDAVTSALGLDSRIGNRYLKGAVSYGGPCFPRDNAALVALARSLGSPALIAETTDLYNRQQEEYLAHIVKSLLPPGGTVGVLGLSYKPGSDVVDESSGLILANLLAKEDIPVVAYDPVAMPNARRQLSQDIRLADNAGVVLADSDVVAVTTTWPDFRDLGGLVASKPRAQTIIDCWRYVASVPEGARHVRLGLGSLATLTSGDVDQVRAS